MDRVFLGNQRVQLIFLGGLGMDLFSALFVGIFYLIVLGVAISLLTGTFSIEDYLQKYYGWHGDRATDFKKGIK